MPQHQRRRALEQWEGDILVLTFVDAKLESEDICARLREELIEVVSQSGAKKVILDFRNVKAVSSVAFRPLLSVRRILQQTRGRMLLCNLPECVAQMFHATRLLASDQPAAATFQEQATLADAIAQLKRGEGLG